MAGYTKIENELFSFLYSNELNGSELKVLLFLLRFSKGYNRSTVSSSYGVLSKATGLSRETCRKAIKSLCGKGLIKQAKKGTGSSGGVVQVLYKSWRSGVQGLYHPSVQQLEDTSVQQSYHQYSTNNTLYTEKYNTGASADFTNNSDAEKSWEELNAEDWED